MVKMSMGHPNTQGCKFEQDLQTVIEKGDKVDANLVDLESVFLQGLVFFFSGTWKPQYPNPTYRFRSVRATPLNSIPVIFLRPGRGAGGLNNLSAYSFQHSS